MNYTRLLLIMRWVVTPIIIAIIAGYFQVRVNNAKEQTRATYDTLAPVVSGLTLAMAELKGRVEELSKRPICEESQPAAKSARLPTSRPKPSFLGSGKVEVTVDAPSAAPEPAPSKALPDFDRMIQQQKKY